MARSRSLLSPVNRLLPLGLVLVFPSVSCGESSSAPSGSGGSGASAGRGGASGTPGSAGANEEAANGGLGADGGSGGASDGEPPADVAGEYTVSLTNEANTCMLNWRQGAVTEGVMFTIRQDGENLTAEAGGDAAVSLVLITGTNAFTGDIHGDAFTLIANGPTVFTTGSCSYTVEALVEGTLDGDSIQGTLTYRPVLGADTECAQYACEAVEAFTGTRPSAG